MDVRVLATYSLEGGSRCPQCLQLLDACTNVSALVDSDHEGGKPEPGCLTVCTYCGLILTFTDDLKLRRATVQEMLKLQATAPDMFEVIAKGSAAFSKKGQQE